MTNDKIRKNILDGQFGNLNRSFLSGNQIKSIVETNFKEDYNKVRIKTSFEEVVIYKEDYEEGLVEFLAIDEMKDYNVIIIYSKVHAKNMKVIVYDDISLSFDV
jgi:hypothetical protein